MLNERCITKGLHFHIAIGIPIVGSARECHIQGGSIQVGIEIETTKGALHIRIYQTKIIQKTLNFEDKKWLRAAMNSPYWQGGIAAKY